MSRAKRALARTAGADDIDKGVANARVKHSAEPTLVAERPQLNTHNVIVDFGKHKGELWTRLPIGYLKWMLNEMPQDSEKYQMAESELNRRGDTMPREVEISNHAVDKASLRVRKAWHTDRGEDEGLYSWLVRICTEALELKNQQNEQNERINHKGCKLVFTYGNFFPTLKTVMTDKSWRLPLDERNFRTNRQTKAQASPDLLETERERILDLVEAGMDAKLTKIDWETALKKNIPYTNTRLAEAWLDGKDEGYYLCRTHTLEVIERLRRSSSRINPTVPTEAKHGKGKP